MENGNYGEVTQVIGSTLDARFPEDKLPEVIVSDGYAPPMVNTPQLVRRLKLAWGEALGEDRLDNTPEQSMVAEDFPFFVLDPDIPTVYWNVGGTPAADFEREAAGGGGSTSDPVASIPASARAFLWAGASNSSGFNREISMKSKPTWPSSRAFSM